MEESHRRSSGANDLASNLSYVEYPACSAFLLKPVLACDLHGTAPASAANTSGSLETALSKIPRNRANLLWSGSAGRGTSDKVLAFPVKLNLAGKPADNRKPLPSSLR